LGYNQNTIIKEGGVPMKESEASGLRQNASRLITERQLLENILMQQQRLLRGSLLERPKFCGKPGCKCTKGQPHPPSLYLSRLVKGTVRHLFIRAADHERARKEARSYKAYRQALRRWRSIDRELNQIWEELEAAQEESYPFE
jgi:hypothetical protein